MIGVPIAACPAFDRSTYVGHRENVADAVVGVLLGVSLQCFRVVGKGNPHDRRKLRVIPLDFVLSGVFPSVDLDEPIECVVGIIVVWIHARVREEHGLLRLVANRGDVPGRVVNVVQVLKIAAVARTHRVNPDQSERIRIVDVRHREARTIGSRVRNPSAPSGSVVIESRYKSDRVIRSTKANSGPFQKVSLVVRGQRHAFVRRDDFDDAIERVVTGSRGERLSLQ